MYILAIILATVFLISFVMTSIFEAFEELEQNSQKLARKETLSLLQTWEIEILKMKIKTMENTSKIK
jgi:hypothetical protein